jgi:hypothetical protein
MRLPGRSWAQPSQLTRGAAARPALGTTPSPTDSECGRPAGSSRLHPGHRPQRVAARPPNPGKFRLARHLHLLDPSPYTAFTVVPAHPIPAPRHKSQPISSRTPGHHAANLDPAHPPYRSYKAIAAQRSQPVQLAKRHAPPRWRATRRRRRAAEHPRPANLRGLPGICQAPVSKREGRGRTVTKISKPSLGTGASNRLKWFSSEIRRPL